ncbi:MAG: 4Fe-4S dicluster domain-containing protein [Candidatus Latescibacterota bacterium]
MARRQVVRIDAERCTGCGDCVTACAEGAIAIVDGKARLVSEVYCDGLGACLGECPEGAITVEEREAPAFDEEAVRVRLAALWADGQQGARLPATCPSTRVVDLGEGEAPAAGPRLGHWPIKLRLVAPDAPFLRGAEVMLVADCVGFAWGDLRQEMTPQRAVLIGCPKFDDYGLALERLTGIVEQAALRTLTVVRMEVPCCAGYWHLAQEARARAGSQVPLRQVVIGVRGNLQQPGEGGLLRIERS